MISLVFIGFILNEIGILKGWVLFWYILGVIVQILKDITIYFDEM